MAKVICIGNHKGGVGKTTVTANLGSLLSQMGKKVLLIDLDAQANLTDYFLLQRPEKSIFESLTEEIPLPITKVRDGLDIVASSLDMLDIEARLSDNIDRAELLKYLIEPISDNYNYILLDCPPSLGIVTLNGLIAATDLYVTLTAETIPVKGLKMLTDAMAKVQKRKNPSLKLSGIIINRWAGRNLNRDIENSLRQKYGDIVFKTRIRENISIAEAPSFLEDVASYAPGSHGAEDYKALTEEVLKRTK